MRRTIDWSTEINADRLDNLRFLAATGESLEGAAQRLGITVASLDTWCRRHGHTDLYQQLAARGEYGHGARVGRVELGRLA